MTARRAPAMVCELAVDTRDRVVVEVEHADWQSYSRTVGPRLVRGFKASEHAWGRWRLNDTSFSVEHEEPEVAARLAPHRSLSRYEFLRRN